MKKIALNHPFFASRKNVLSERAAEKILRENSPTDVKEVIRRARPECGITEPIENELCKGSEMNRLPKSR